ncbi:MAG: superoxide dismutase, Cu-Zn family, partial [Burkholderiaceae bacterium]|nr:superoxide dismutase, Cu-Zn family [Burkholderiaceae bacterium]
GPYSVVNRAIVIHESPDDYRSQPAGNSGARIACGVIRSMD